MKKGITEVLLAYIICGAINYFFLPADPGFVSYRLHPFIFVTLLFAVRYGMWEGGLAGLLGACMILYGQYQAESGLLMDFLFDFEALSLPFSLIVTGLLVGEATQGRAQRADYYKGALNREIVTHEKTRRSRQALKDSLLHLEKKLADHGMGIQSFFDHLLKMFANDRLMIYEKLQEIMKQQLHVRSSLLLLRSENIYQHKAFDGLGEVPQESVLENLKKNPVYLRALTERKVTSLSDFLDDEHDSTGGNDAPIFFCGPVLDIKGHIDALVLVTDIPFIHYNITSFRLFEVVIEAASLSLKNLDRIEKLRSSTPYHDLWPVERESYFLKNLEMELEVREKFDVLLCGFAFAPHAKESQRSKLKTLLAYLLLEERVRIGHLEEQGCFACYAPAGKDPKTQAWIAERLSAYGIPETLAKLLIVEHKLSAQDPSQQGVFLARNLSEGFERARSTGGGVHA
ncbi:MAG: hypothetical protein HQL31_00210 [Planctomycetes bacterium]|nr:hypothetical protein [Planctomycetota bacterium]